VLSTGEPLLEHLSEAQAAAPEPFTIGSAATGESTRSLVMVPLKIGADTIGVYSVQSYQSNAYTQEHLNLLINIASQVAVAIVNARLFEQTRRAEADLNALNRRLTGEAWQSYAQTRSSDAVIWHANDPTLGQVGRAQVEQLAAGEVAAQHLAGETEISIPIALRGQLIGALRFRTPADKWTDQMQAIATSVAGHLAQAAENTRLIEQTQRTAQREKQIALAADKIHRASDLDAILQIAVSEIARITGAADVGIQLDATHARQPVEAGNPRGNEHD
jgi:GAF domain-containing protein